MIDIMATNIFGYIFVYNLERQLCKYSNIFKYFNRNRKIYSFGKYFLKLFGLKYTWTFICQRKIKFATHWFSEKRAVPSEATVLPDKTNSNKKK